MKNGWTVNTLLELMNERDKRYNERFLSQQEAIKVAQDNTKAWQAASNEWRAAMTDREINFFSKTMGNVLIVMSSVAVVITILDKVFLR